jgi:hypothetical protein
VAAPLSRGSVVARDSGCGCGGVHGSGCGCGGARGCDSGCDVVYVRRLAKSDAAGCGCDSGYWSSCSHYVPLSYRGKMENVT